MNRVTVFPIKNINYVIKNTSLGGLLKENDIIKNK